MAIICRRATKKTSRTAALSSNAFTGETQTVMLRVHDWVLPRRRQLIAVIIAVVAIFLVINGIGSL